MARTPLAFLLLAGAIILPTQAIATPIETPVPHRGFCDGPDPSYARHPIEGEAICAARYAATQERRAERRAERQAELAAELAAEQEAAAEAAAATETTTQTTTTTTSTTPTSSGAGCVGMEAESGSTGYATDTGNGYVGCYQISEDHFAPGGSCAGYGTDPAGQDACAGEICATEGSGAWTNPAGENPCDRLGG